MPFDEKTITDDVHLGLRFWVEIDGIEIAGFSECSGLTVETEMFEYAEGGWNVHTYKLPGRLKYGNITLKRGINPGGELYTWFKQGTGLKPAKRKNLTITIYSPELADVKHWNVREAYPVKWTGPDFKTDSGAVAIETLEIAHHGFLPPEKDTPSKANFGNPASAAAGAVSQASQAAGAGAAPGATGGLGGALASATQAASGAAAAAQSAEAEASQGVAAADQEAKSGAAAAQQAAQSAESEAQSAASEAKSEAAAAEAEAKSAASEAKTEAAAAENEAKSAASEAKSEAKSAENEAKSAGSEAKDATKGVPKI